MLNRKNLKQGISDALVRVEKLKDSALSTHQYTVSVFKGKVLATDYVDSFEDFYELFSFA